MSQKSEKYARRLRADMDELQRRMDTAEGILVIHDSRLDKAAKWAASVEGARQDMREIQIRKDAQRRRELREEVRAAERAARNWKTMTYAALVAAILVLIVAILADRTRAVEIPTEPIQKPLEAAQTVPLPEPAEVPETAENALIEAALLSRANVIEGCEVTWYTAATCGKAPDDPAYGITYSGLPVVEHQTCAVDPNVIPLYSDVFVEYADGTIEQLWATDTGVQGNALDIYTPDYDYAIQCGRQLLTVRWVAPEGVT